MYSDNLKEKNISIDSLFLDPNNPRFWDEKINRTIADKKIPEAAAQAKASEKIKDMGVEELKFSILRNGFLPLDRIVVRAIAGHTGKYVVVEGNRRLAALKLLRRQIDDDLIDEEQIKSGQLQRIIEQTNNINVLVYDGKEKDDISWVLQGVRHISGIREWKPAQRAKLVAAQIDNSNMGFGEAGQKFGLTAQAVGRLYRAYKALQQMREDDDYQSKARNDYFSLFEEASKNQIIKKWLDWDEKEFKFKNIDNLETFYRWISPDEEYDNRRRIHDPKHVKDLAILIEGKHKTLLTKIENFQVGLEEAVGMIEAASESSDWREALSKASKLIGSIPSSAILDETSAFLSELQRIAAVIEKSQKMAKAAK